MFSATLHSDEVKDVAAKICQKPIVVDLKVLSMSMCSTAMRCCHTIIAEIHRFLMAPCVSHMTEMACMCLPLWFY